MCLYLLVFGSVVAFFFGGVLILVGVVFRSVGLCVALWGRWFCFVVWGCVLSEGV